LPTVTLEAVGQAAAILAQKLTARTGGRAGQLVLAPAAVWPAITLPGQRDAATLHARELI